MGLPRALRVLRLSDRLVLHDISHKLRGDPSDRNALIDATNSVHTRELSAAAAEQPSLIDLALPTPPPRSSSSGDRYLVLPFSTADGEEPPAFVASSPEQAGAPLNASASAVDAAAGLLGVIRLTSGRYAVLVTQVRRAGALPSGSIYAASKVKLIALFASSQPRDERDLPAAIVKLLESGALYYSLATDLTRATSNSSRRRPAEVPNAFWWTWPLAARLGRDGALWALRPVYGFVGTNIMRFQSRAMPAGAGDFRLTLVSRRSRRRAGTRYITRGVDALGDVANFVETEQIVWNDERPEAYSAFVIIRGSVPVFWRQNNGIARPAPELDGNLTASRAAFAAHFKEMTHSYGGVAAVSLVDKHGSESVLADAFERHFDLDLRGREGPLVPKLVAFDFHSHCTGKEYERGLAKLLERLREDIVLYGIFATGLEATKKNDSQMGVFRVNCVDCLDRTNVVQSMVSRVALDMQLDAVFSPELLGAVDTTSIRLYGESEDRFKHVWGDNADAVSKQYSGTGALKTDFTRTGKRSTTGVIGDGMKSVMRMYYKNFVDEGRQEVIDILCGNAVIRPPALAPNASTTSDATQNGLETEGTSRTTAAAGIWYSFQAVRVNASGDKQTVLVELHDESMYVTTNEGISFQYPRSALVSWSKFEDGKSSDKKSTVRLRLLYRPSRRAPSTASPLDLQFKGGTTARENFLRAVVSWAKPASVSSMCKQDVRVRTLAALNAGEHLMEDWGLSRNSDADEKEIVALIVPEGNALTRSWGLAAVPLDVDDSNYVLVSALAVSDHGPAIAILASKAVAQSVMNVSEAMSGRSAMFAAGGAIAVALEACGTSLCFVSARLSGAEDVYHSLTTLKLGRASFDVTNQYHHFVLGGLLGDIQWRHESAPASGPGSRKWVRLGDGSACYSMENGLGVLRNSFPSLRYEDRICRQSYWKDGGQDSAENGSMTCVALSDGIVDGRPGPRLSKTVSQSVVTVSDLKGDDIKSPPGIDPNTQLNSFVVLHSEYAIADAVSTRPTPRPTSFPEWRDSIHLIMMPSDPEDIFGGFLVGQIVVPTPLSDPVSAGHFVIPISAAADGPMEFNIPCRLAGIPTGRLTGRVQVEFGGKELIEKLEQQQLQRRPARAIKQDGSLNDRNGLPQIPRQGTVREDPFGQGSADGMRKSSSSKTSGFASSRLQKPSMEDMNKNLDAARKKGSKQIKSMVGRLSSLLNQPSSSSSAPLSRRATTRDGEYVGRRSDAVAEEDSYREAYDGIGQASSNADPFVIQNNGHLGSRSKSNRSTGIGSEKVGQMPGSERIGTSASRATSAISSEPPLLDFDDGAFGSFQTAAAGGESDRSVRTGHVGTDDALLSGLRANVSHASQGGSQRREVPVHARIGSEDLLLSGLAIEKRNAKSGSSECVQEEDWGDFEAVLGASNGDGSGGGTLGRGSNRSLLDL